MLQFQQPSYLASLIPRYVPARALRSSSSLSICVPTRKTTMAASKSFSSVASGIWNALPNHLSSIPTLPVFRRALKHHLFLLAYPDSSAKSGMINPAQCISLRGYSANYCHRAAHKYHAAYLVAFHLSVIRLAKRFISHRLHTGAWGNLVLLTYLLTFVIFCTL